jgi:hypothetical protein
LIKTIFATDKNQMDTDEEKVEEVEEVMILSAAKII